MKKHLISFLFVLILLTAGLSVSVFAESCDICGNNTTWTFEEDGTLIINGTGKIICATPHDDSILKKESVKQIIIKEGITSIGDSIFKNYTAVTSVTLPESLTYMGSYAFENCDSLTTISIPDAVTIIGKKTFDSCDTLTSVKLPKSLELVGLWGFDNCKSLTHFYYPGTADQFLDIDISILNDELETLPVYCEYTDGQCSGSCGIKTRYIFDIETKQLTISGHGSMSQFGSYAGSQLPVPPWHTYRNVIDTIVIDLGVITIGTYAFYNCDALTNVKIPDTVISIEEYAFANCDVLTNIIIPDSVTSIDSYAFEYSDSLTSVTLPNSITTINQCTFRNCVSLSNIKIPESVTTIETLAFEKCSALTSINIPNSVCSLSSLFRDCDNLKSITLPNAVDRIPSRMFEDCDGLTTFNIPSNINYIENGAFSSCDNLKSITIPNTMKEIKDSAFFLCDNLETVYYYGTQEQWNEIIIGVENYPLSNANIVFMINPFTDVSENDWYFNSVMWAKNSNVTGGTSANTFGPNDSCTRAQVVTFLWAANGKPEPASMENPFSDVPNDAWYLKPVLWAVENGITGGVSEGMFGPEQTCTRAQIVTFLYAAIGKPSVEGKSTFSDVADTDWFVKPVLWAAQNDVTGGIGNGQFGPNNTCTRGQVVTFLYKVYGNK